MLEQILSEIHRRIYARFPARIYYYDLCPSDFQRPAFLLEHAGIEIEDASRWLVKKNARFIVTCFESLDDYGNTAAAPLLHTKMEVMETFAGGSMQIDDRAIKVAVESGSRDFDWASVDLQFEWYDTKDAPPELPVAETVMARVEQQTQQ